MTDDLRALAERAAREWLGCDDSAPASVSAHVHDLADKVERAIRQAVEDEREAIVGLVSAGVNDEYEREELCRTIRERCAQAKESPNV